MARLFLRWVRSQLFKYTCERCGHMWESTEDPQGCAACHSKYWDHKRGTLKRGRPPKE